MPRPSPPRPLLWAGLGVIARVRGGSMRPLFADGDLVFAVRYRGRPRAGDVALVRAGERRLVKPILGWNERLGRYELGHGAWAGHAPPRDVLARVVLAFSRRRGWLRPPWTGLP